jgi:hypothetical protein
MKQGELSRARYQKPFENECFLRYSALFSQKGLTGGHFFGIILLVKQVGTLQFFGEFLFCTFLSTVTEKYQKNTAKGLGALWTPVFPVWVCLTEDIHGGGFEKRSA